VDDINNSLYQVHLKLTVDDDQTLMKRIEDKIVMEMIND
jgi:hypothetical protein